MPNNDSTSGREITFLDRPFYIDKSVHRPRASTEFITKAGYISYIDQIDRSVTAADIGVGCGVTAISCALECPGVEKIYGIDSSEDALSIAAHNAGTLRASDKVELMRGDLFAPLLGEQVDIIIANLPFASTAKIEEIKAETPTPDEPLDGIHGGKTGFELYEQLFKQLKRYQFMDSVLGMWVFCGAEHETFVNLYHQDQLSDFKLMAFQDKFKPHFSHFLFTRVEFAPGQELTTLH